MIVQDNPAIAGYPIPGELLLKLARERENLAWVKLEGPPTGPKLSWLRAQSRDGIRCFGGLGGQFLLEELARGAAGCLPGAAFPEVHVVLWNAWQGGDREGAARTYRAHMALMRSVGQSADWSHHAYKTLLQRGGIIGTAAVRLPTVSFDDLAAEQLLGHARAVDLAVLRRP